MATNIRIETNTLSVQNLFGQDTSYRIPPFQRPYSWSKNRQWGPLWEDIQNLAKRHLSQNANTRPHFMGAIVMQQRHTPVGVADMRLVIDGQQRLTTLQLAIKAAADVLKKRGIEKRADRLITLTTNRDAYTAGNQDNLVKIRQTNADDRTAFQAIMLAQGEPFPQSNLAKCYDFFVTSIEDYFGGPLFSKTYEGENLAEALETVLSRLLVVATIELTEQDEPYTIFATLNDRGEQLNPSDIVKNMMMQRAEVGDDEEKANRVWGLFENNSWWRESTGENNLKRTQADRFIDHWVSIRTGKARRNLERLPSDIAEHLEDIGRDKTWDAVNDLNQKAETYKHIHQGTLRNGEEFLKKMKALGVGAPMALMLWLFTSDVQGKDRILITNAVESYVVRRSLAGMTTNALRETFPGLIAKVHNTNPKEATKIVIEYLANEIKTNQRWPTNHEIEEFLSSQPMKGTTSAKREIIAAIEAHIRPVTAEPIGPTEQLTIDHIMPQSWKQNWPLPLKTTNKEAAELARDRTVQYIGNLTIITSNLNSTIKNKSWNQKRDLLKDSTLTINRELVKNAPQEWTEEAIKERSKLMAKITTKVWLSPEEYITLAGI